MTPEKLKEERENLAAALQRMAPILEAVATLGGAGNLETLKSFSSLILEEATKKKYDNSFIDNPEYRAVKTLCDFFSLLSYATLKGVSIEELNQLTEENPTLKRLDR